MTIINTLSKIKYNREIKTWEKQILLEVVNIILKNKKIQKIKNIMLKDLCHNVTYLQKMIFKMTNYKMMAWKMKIREF